MWNGAKCLLAFFVVAMFGVSAANAKYLAVVDPWPPYVIGEEDEAPTGGTQYEACREIFRRASIDVDYMLLPWQRCLEYGKRGEADFIMGISKNSSRSEYLEFSKPFIPCRVVFLYRKNRFPRGFSWNTLADFRDYELGIVLGYNYGDDFFIQGKKIPLKLRSFRNEKIIAGCLAAGRIDVGAVYEIPGLYWVNQISGLREKIGVAEKPLMEEGLHIAISKKSPAVHLLGPINEAIVSMEADGTMHCIFGAGQE